MNLKELPAVGSAADHIFINIRGWRRVCLHAAPDGNGGILYYTATICLYIDDIKDLIIKDKIAEYVLPSDPFEYDIASNPDFYNKK